MNSVPKIIYYLIFTGILLNAFNTYNYQSNLELMSTEDVVLWNSKFTFYGYVMISMASVLSFMLYRKHFPKYITVCYITLIILVFITSVRDYETILKNPSFLYSIKGIGTFINIGILFFAANTLYFPKLLKLFYFLCFAFIIAGLVNLKKVGFGAGREQFLFAIREFTIYLIWVFPYFLLQDEPNKRKNTVNLIVFFLIFIFVLCSGSRSYMIIYFIFFIVKFKDQITGKNALLGIASMALLLGAGYLILINSAYSKTVEGAFNILAERSTDDSRSSQLVDFFSQFDLNYLIQGVGPKKTWYWFGVGDYGYLDNQFVLLAWWAGLPTLLVYFYFLARTFLFKSEDFVYKNLRGIKIIIGLWVLACMGFAIYVSVSSELYYYFISLLMGYYTYNFNKTYIEDIEEA